MRKRLLLTRRIFQLLCLSCIVANSYSQSLTSNQLVYNSELEVGSQKEQKLALKNVLKEIQSEYDIYINFDDRIVEDKYLKQETMDEGLGEKDVEKRLIRLLIPFSLKIERIKDNIFLIYEKDKPLSGQTEGAIRPRTIEGGIGSLTSLERAVSGKSVNLAILAPITGRVVDENGQGLPGVSVVAKGTTIGTTTDADGNYSLNVPDATATIVLSFIGYQTQEVVIEGRTTIDVTMVPDVEALNEVVVIGYQTVRKRDLTGAVSVVDPAAANRVTTNSVAESLQGLSPGVTVRNGGAPGQMARIEIRGAASFANTDPLYVIDGMIADANTTINNNDIESMQILKDASAAAIYGSRAANGVVIITTKQGREGPAKVAFSAKYGIQQIPKRWDVMEAAEFAATQRTQHENSGVTPPAGVGTGFNSAINTDWQDEVMRFGSLQDYNLTLSGGSKTGTYLVSGSYFHNDGVLIANSFNRATLRVNTKITKGRVTFGENILLSNSNQRLPGEGNPFYDAPQMLPIIPVRGDEFVSNVNPGGWGIGTIGNPSYVRNSVAVSELASRKMNFGKLVGNAYVDVKLTDWLNYRFNTGAEVSYDLIKNVRGVGIWSLNDPPRPSFVNEERSRFLNLLFEHTLNFNKTLGLHNINGVVGISSQRINRETTFAARTNLLSSGGTDFTTIGSATGESSAGGGVPVEYRIFGYLGRLNYSFNDKYLVTLTGRVDKDSRFGENYRTGFFPSVALGWRISNEEFFNVNWISNLKIHASYGELGIVTLNSWDYTPFINNNPRAIFGVDQTPFVGATQAQLANPDLKWEDRIVKNIGLDASFFDNRLSVTIEGYNSLAKDNLLQLDVAGYLGNLGGPPYVNAGSIRNSGIEFAATYRNDRSDFKWDVSANFTTIRNKVESVGNQGEGIDYIQLGNTRTKVGRSMGEWYVIQTDGIFQNETEIENHVNSLGEIIQPNAEPGDIRYVDLNDDGEINAQDRTFVGSPWPKVQAGAQFNASFKGFTLNLQLVGVFGYTIYNDTRRFLDSYQNVNFRKDIDPWSTTNPGGKDPRLGLETQAQGIIDNNRPETDRWIENGSYVRLRNIELGYNLPANLFGDGLALENARVYISGQNLFTITGYKGLDPDIVGNTDPNNSRARILERGVDVGNWPASRAFSIGIQFGF